MIRPRLHWWIVGVGAWVTSLGCSSPAALPSTAGGGAGGAGTSSTGGGGGAASPGSGALGAHCSTDSDCASTICARGRCAVSCRVAADCLPGPEWTCALIPGRGSVCQCSETGAEVCDGRDNDCNGVVDDGATCPGELKCTDGGCGCPSAAQCGTACVDLETDPRNCGTCDSACPAGASCVSGKCVCPSGASVCGDNCIDLSTDRNNCGACGTACSPAEECVGGHKTCAHTLCAGVCVDTDEDPANCGACGHDCGGGACFDALCQPIELIPGENANGVAVDSNHIYWSNVQVNEIRSASLDGKNVATLATGHYTRRAFTQMAVNSTGVYWEYAVSAIFGAPFDAVPCVATPLPSTCVLVINENPNGDSVNGFTVDDTSVYWTTGGGLVRRAALDGTGLVTLTTKRNDPKGIVRDGTTLYWVDPGQSYGGIGSLNRMNTDGSALNELVFGYASEAIAVHGGDLFWSQLGSVVKSPVAGGAVTALSRGTISSTLADDDWVYWWGDAGDFWYDGIFKAPVSGGPPIRIADRGGVMAQDARFIYIATYDGDRLLRLAK